MQAFFEPWRRYLNYRERRDAIGVVGRLSSREIATAIAYLVSDEAAYVTGQVLRVNGGMYM